MKLLFYFSIATLSLFPSFLYSQIPGSPKLFAHQVSVDSILQTKAYTYLLVRERIKEKDSLQWMALPLFEPKIGDIYYYDNGLQMGEFQSKELNRTFSQILFLGYLSTTVEASVKNIVPKPVLDTIPKDQTPAILHVVVVKEVIQTSGYTYLRVTEENKEEWIAIVKIPASVGQIYTYTDAAPMNDFMSKELNRTFKDILFISRLTLRTKAEIAAINSAEQAKIKSSNNNSKEINSTQPAQPAEEITIAKLFENKKTYSGKSVIIKGKVTKYSRNILDKNWIHLEDGTTFSGKFDLVVTIDDEVKVGDNIIVTGSISMERDFGSGYFFDVIMENGKVQIK